MRFRSSVVNIGTRALVLLIASGGLMSPVRAQQQAQDCVFTAKAGGSAKAQTLALEASKVNPCTTVPGLKAKSLSAVWTAMLATSKTGGKRFDAPPPEGWPSGRVVPGEKGIEFNLQQLAVEGVLSLRVSAGSTTLFNVVNPTQASVWLPLDRLKPGASYVWMLSTRKGNYKADFELLEADEAAAVQAQLVALAAAPLSPQMRLLYRAAILDEAELYVERDQVLYAIRQQLNP